MNDPPVLVLKIGVASYGISRALALAEARTGDAERAAERLERIARQQVELGITKFKASTIAEAEVCATAGAADVLLAFPPAGPNLARLCELARQFPQTTFVCDCAGFTDMWFELPDLLAENQNIVLCASLIW